MCLGWGVGRGGVADLIYTYANWPSSVLVRTGWGLPLLQGQFHLYLWWHRVWVSNQISVSAHCSLPLPHALHCSSKPCCGALSAHSGAWHCLKLLDNYLPPAHSISCMLPLPCWVQRRGRAGRLRFPSRPQHSVPLAALNRAMGCYMLYSRFQVDQSKCLLLNEGTRCSGAVEPANFLYIVHLHFLLSSIILISCEAVMCSNRRIYFSVVVNCGLMAKMGFPDGAMVKYPPANAGATRDVGSISGSERSPGVGNGNPLQYSCLENSLDRRAW